MPSKKPMAWAASFCPHMSKAMGPSSEMKHPSNKPMHLNNYLFKFNTGDIKMFCLLGDGKFRACAIRLKANFYADKSEWGLIYMIC